jgi:6-pyruvoyltetrahydropterin/6-carboxytetrahydropterin synthase
LLVAPIVISTMYRLEIRHNAEAAHRFWQADCSPKCRSIHGHSWHITLTLKATKLDDQGMVVEFGQLKRHWRTWLDTHLDHTLMLHQDDPLVVLLRGSEPDLRLFLLPTDPTTENLAEHLTRQAQVLLESLGYSPQVQVERVRLEETQVNAAEYWVESPLNPRFIV